MKVKNPMSQNIRIFINFNHKYDLKKEKFEFFNGVI